MIDKNDLGVVKHDFDVVFELAEFVIAADWRDFFEYLGIANVLVRDEF